MRFPVAALQGFSNNVALIYRPSTGSKYCRQTALRDRLGYTIGPVKNDPPGISAPTPGHLPGLKPLPDRQSKSQNSSGCDRTREPKAALSVARWDGIKLLLSLMRSTRRISIAGGATLPETTACLPDQEERRLLVQRTARCAFLLKLIAPVSR
jgi:hypothetical protein